jgi:hypothetical protein
MTAAADDSNNEIGGDAPLTQPEPQTPSAIVVTQNELLKSVIDDLDQEEDFINDQSVPWKRRRDEIIENIKDKNSKLYLKKADVLKYKLG